MVVLSGLRLPSPAVMLKRTVDVMSDLDLPTLLSHQLLHSLPRRIVKVIGVPEASAPPI